MTPSLATAGLFVGFMIGLTGVGSGALMAPLLLIIGIPPAVVVGSDLGFSLLTKIVGGGVHLRQSTVNWVWVRRLASGSIPGALIGSVLAVRLAASPSTLRSLVGLVLVLSASTAVTLELLRRRYPERIQRLREPRPRTVVAIGFMIGVLVGSTSVGSGSLVDVALVLFSPLSGAQLVGTGLVHAVLLTGVGSLTHWQFGTLDFALIGALLVGSIPGVLLGSWATRHIGSQSLRWWVTAVVFLSGLTTLIGRRLG